MFFSIIVPIYNIDSYLERCLASITKQTFKDFEVIMVDDGSTDLSNQIARKYLNDYRFVLIVKNNEGLGYARNDGIDISSGKYLVFIDGDDWIDPDYLLEAHRIIETANAEIIRFGWYVDGDDACTKHDCFKDDTIDFIRTQLLIDNIGSQAWKNIYKRNLFSAVRFPKGLYEDMPVTFRLFYSTNLITVSDRCFYHYFLRPSSISFSYNTKKPFYIYSGFLSKYMYALDKKMSLEIMENLSIKTINAGLEAIRWLTLEKESRKTIRDIYGELKRIKNQTKPHLKRKEKIELLFLEIIPHIYLMFVKHYYRWKYKL